MSDEVTEERWEAILRGCWNSFSEKDARAYLAQQIAAAEIRGQLTGTKIRDASLHLLVWIALKAEEISEGKACELTGIDRITVREKVQDLPPLYLEQQIATLERQIAESYAPCRECGSEPEGVYGHDGRTDRICYWCASPYCIKSYRYHASEEQLLPLPEAHAAWNKKNR